MSETFSTPSEFEITTIGKGKPIISDSPAIGSDDIDTDVPASIFEQRYGITLASNILDIKGESQDDQQKLKVVDEYIKDKILEEDLEDTQESYKYIIDELMRIAGISKLDNSKLDKLNKIIILRRFLN